MRRAEPGAAASDTDGDERSLLEALRARSEPAFHQLVVRHQPAMLRVARLYVPSPAVAEEVVQETWLAVVTGVERFEGRSSLKTWIFRILTNRARTRGVKEHRSIAFSSLEADSEETGPAVDPERFLEQGHRWAGHWAVPPEPWRDVPAERLAERETRAVIEETIGTLPARQRQVITLRDIEAWTSEEVCDLLYLSEGNQRVLLHRARSRVRAALEQHFGQDG